MRLSPERRAELIVRVRAHIAQLEAEILELHADADREKLLDTRDDMVIELRRLYEPGWEGKIEGATDTGDANNERADG